MSERTLNDEAQKALVFAYELRIIRAVKAYKYKLKPSRKIIAIFEAWLLALCELYNAALQERRDAYRMAGVSISKSDQEKQLPEIKQENPRLARIHSQVTQEALRRVDLAFQHFFRRVREGQVPGYPRFRSCSRYDSFTYKQKGFKLDQKTKKLHLSKIGSVKVFLSRPISGNIKTCTIKREADGWYVIFVVDEIEKKVVVLAPDVTIGIDVGLKTFAHLSNDDQIPNPQYHRQAESELKTAQRRVSARKKGAGDERKPFACWLRSINTWL